MASASAVVRAGFARATCSRAMRALVLVAADAEEGGERGAEGAGPVDVLVAPGIDGAGTFGGGFGHPPNLGE